MELSKLYLECRTIRKFQQKEIKEEDLEYILTNLRYVHSGNNKQTLTYLVVTNMQLRQVIAHEITYAAILPREIAEPKDNEQAMAYLIICADKQHSRVVDIDTGIAAEYVVESAFEKGIGSCMMLNYNVEHINEILQIPNTRSAAMVIALGYPALTSAAVDMVNGDTAYTCDEYFHYEVPKKSLMDIAKILK